MNTKLREGSERSPVRRFLPIKENTRDEIRPLGSFGSHVCNGRNPGDGARGYLKPGYCAQFYPNAKCQNKGPNNPYTGDYQLRNQLRGAFAWSANPCAQGAASYRGRDGRRYYCY